MFRQRTHYPGHVEFARGPTSITDQTALSSGTSWSAWSPGTNATDLSVGVRVHTSYTRREVIHRLASAYGDSTPRVSAGNLSAYFREMESECSSLFQAISQVATSRPGN